MDKALITKTLDPKAMKGLALTFVLSFVNLAGAFLALSVLGGLEPWTSAQFVGLFGLIEAAVGLSFVFAPNIWRLPVAEANAGRTEVRLAASTVLIPHWLALAKVISGVLMLGYAGWAEGLGLVTVALVPEILLIAVAFLAFAIAAARAGVERPDLDVIFVSIRRPGSEAKDLPGITLTGVGVQLISNIGIFPAVELLSPGVLFQPELGPSPELLLWTGVVAALACLVAVAAWHGRITWRAPREQQREAEAELTA
jgi:hypothetical protein